MPDQPLKISIITVCYNSAATITDTLCSVVAQTWTQIEHIIIDGGSTDGTQNLVRQHGAKDAILVSEPDEGIYDAMNKGLRLATGDLVGFLNADDALAAPDVMADLAARAKRTGADVVYGDLEYVACTDTERVVRRWQSGEFENSLLRRGWMPPHPTFYVQRSLLQRLGGFDTQFRIAADYDFMVRYLRSPGMRVTYLPRLMVRMRTGGVSGNRSIQAVLRRNIESYKVVRKNGLGGWAVVIFKSLRKVSQLFR